MCRHAQRTGADQLHYLSTLSLPGISNHHHTGLITSEDRAVNNQSGRGGKESDYDSMCVICVYDHSIETSLSVSRLIFIVVFSRFFDKTFTLLGPKCIFCIDFLVIY